MDLSSPKEPKKGCIQVAWRNILQEPPLIGYQTLNEIFLLFFYSAGLVSKQARQVAKKGAHQKGPWAAGTQRPPCHVLGRPHPCWRTEAEGASSPTKETDEVAGEAAEKTSGQGGDGGSGDAQARVGESAGRRWVLLNFLLRISFQQHQCK